MNFYPIYKDIEQLLGLLFRSNFKESLIVIFFQFLSIVFQIKGLALLLRLVSDLLSQKNFLMIPYVDILIPLRNQGVLWIFVGIFILLASSAVAMYISKRLAANIVVGVENFCIERVFKLQADRVQKIRTGDDVDINRIVAKDCRYCGRAINEILNSIMPIIIILVAGLYIVYLSWAITIGVGVLLIFGSFFYGLLSSETKVISKNLEEYSKKDVKKKFAFLNWLDSLRIRNSENFNFKKVVESDEAKIHMVAYRDRLKIAHKSLFIGSSQFAVVMSLIGYFVSRDLVGGQSIDYALFYILGLQYVVSNVRGVQKNLTNISVFEPYFSRYFKLECAYQSKDETSIAPKTIRLSSENQRRVLVVMQDGALISFSKAAIQISRKIFNECDPNEMIIINEDIPHNQISALSSLYLESIEELLENLEKIKFSELAIKLKNNFDLEANPDRFWKKLTPEIKKMLVLSKVPETQQKSLTLALRLSEDKNWGQIIKFLNFLSIQSFKNILIVVSEEFECNSRFDEIVAGRFDRTLYFDGQELSSNKQEKEKTDESTKLEEEDFFEDDYIL